MKTPNYIKATLAMLGILGFLLLGIAQAALGANLPQPWANISDLSDQQRAQIEQIVAFYKNKVETEKANVIRSRTAYHQNGGTMSLATNDIIQWTHQTVRINGLFERNAIMGVLSPQQQQEANVLWQKMDRTEAAENFQPFEVKQKNAMWCWAASVSVILNYNGVAWDQDRVAQEIKGTSDAWEKATATEIADGLNRMKTSPDPRQSWMAMCRHEHGNLEGPRMINALEFGRPMLAALDEVHVVVVHKVVYRENASSGQREIQSIELFDPLEHENKTLTWAEAVTKLTDVWYPVVSPFPNNRFSAPAFPGDRF